MEDLTKNPKAIEQFFDRFKGMFLKHLIEQLNDVSSEFISDFVKDNISGQNLKVRSGDLRRSFGYKVEGKELKNIKTTLYSTSPYANIHEFGGEITPKNSKYLAIPLSAAKTASGVSRYSSPRNAPPLVFIQTKAGKKLLMNKSTKEFLYVLVNRVKIPARMGFRDKFKKYIPKFSKASDFAAKKSWNEASKKV